MSLQESLKNGVIAGFFGSLCCTTPMLIVALGLGSIGFALGFAKYRPFFIILGVVFLSLALYKQTKKKHGVCNLSTIKKDWVVIIVALITTLIIWTLLIYAIVPLLGQLVYR